MEKAVKISRDEANEIIKNHLNLPKQKVCICYAGQWYDITKLNDEEITDLVNELIKK